MTYAIAVLFSAGMAHVFTGAGPWEAWKFLPMLAFFLLIQAARKLEAQ